MVWTTVQAQAAAAVHYFVERQLQGPTLRDFGDDAKQWTIAADSEQWFWQREGKIVERLARGCRAAPHKLLASWPHGHTCVCVCVRARERESEATICHAIVHAILQLQMWHATAVPITKAAAIDTRNDCAAQLSVCVCARASVCACVCVW